MLQDDDSSLLIQQDTEDLKKKRIKDLYSIYIDVEKTLDETIGFIHSLKASKHVDFNDVLELAERIAPTAFAPVGWNEGLPLLNAFAPAPQAEQMRIGKLSMFNLSKEAVVKQTFSKGDNEILSEEEQTRAIVINRVKGLKDRLKEKKQQKQVSAMEVDTGFQLPSTLQPSDRMDDQTAEMRMSSPGGRSVGSEHSAAPVVSRKVNIAFGFGVESESEEEENGSDEDEEE
jgi:predicted phosphoadenosine phosphosulfate sulfurtransferase